MDTLETLTIRRECVSSIIDILKTSPVAEKEQNLRKIKKEMSIKMTYSAAVVMNKLKEMLKIIDQEINQNQNKQKLDDTLKMIEKQMKMKGLLKKTLPAADASTTINHHKTTYSQLRKQVRVEMTRMSMETIRAIWAKKTSAEKMSTKKSSPKKISPIKSSLKAISYISNPAVTNIIQTKYPSYLNSVTIKLVKNIKNVIDRQTVKKKNNAMKINRYNIQTSQPLSNLPPLQSDDHRRITRGLLEDRQFIKLRTNTFNTDEERVVKSKHMFMDALQLRPTF